MLLFPSLPFMRRVAQGAGWGSLKVLKRSR